MRFFSFLIFFLAINLVFFNSCKTDTSRTNKDRKELELAKLISELPAQIIAPDAALHIRFVDPVIHDTTQTPPQDILKTTPTSRFRLSWSDVRTLRATPMEPMRPGTEYSGVLNLNVLSPDHFKDEKPLLFTFRTLTQEVTRFNGAFELEKENNPNVVVYAGRISLLLKIGLKQLKTAFSFSEAGKKIPLSWAAGTDGKSFTFKTDPIRRTKTDRHFLAHLSDGPLHLERAFKYDIILPAVTRFKAMAAAVEGGEANPRIKITFSDALADRQDIRGLISISPHLPLKIKKSTRFAIVSAPFVHGQDYRITIHKGIRSKWGTQTGQDTQKKLTFENIQPQIRFSGSGIILPSDNEQKVAFMTVNVRKVHLRVMRVFESNIGQFLQMERLDGNNRRRNEFSYQMNRVGLTIADTDLVLSSTPNQWLQSEVDIKKLIKGHARGFLLLHLSFAKKDMAYQKPPGDNSYRSYRQTRRNRYGEVGSYWYMYNMANVYKPVLVSDIGLTLKTGPSDTRVFTTDLISGKPLPKVHIVLRSYQNQVIGELETDSEGMARFYDLEGKIFYVEGLRDGQHSIIKTNDMSWNLSSFDVSGTIPQHSGYKAFIYNDRGVYRPGDTAHVSVIFRSDEKPVPDGLPVTMSVKNPRGQLVYSTTNKTGRDGFYSFSFSSTATDPSGLYQVRFRAGASGFTHTLRIETIAPERIKVKVTASPEILTGQTGSVAIGIKSKYLFGTPAKGLGVHVQVTVSDVPTHFKSFKNFIFNSALKGFQGIDETVGNGTLDANGAYTVNWQIPALNGAPGLLQVLFKVSVREKGGRMVKRQRALPYHLHKRYVGYRPADLQWNYARLNEPLKIPTVMVDTGGRALPGKTIHYSIYHNQSNWWWEYNSRDRFRLRFKEAVNSVLVDEGDLISGSRPVDLKFSPSEFGEYMVEFSDPVKGGHTVQYFFSAGFYGGNNRSKDAGDLALHSNKKEYHPGEKAVVSFPMPTGAIALVTVEKGGKILENHWHYPSKNGMAQNIRIPITEEMQPTAYVSVSVIQPHKATLSDRPLRSYGVIPLNIRNPKAKENIEVQMPESLKPGQSFDIRLQTADGRPMQFTIALVDEGLLQLTRFKTPAPLAWLFRKEKLSVRSYDLYGKVLGANRGDIFKTFSIGGDIAFLSAEARNTGNKDKNSSVRRFKPVAFFKGPLASDANGTLTVHFTMPDYVGEVRLMVIAANKKRYGNLEKSIPVKSDLMVLPTAPRVLGPGDITTLPITVFANVKPDGPVRVSIKTTGPLSVIGPAEHSITFTAIGEQDIRFKVQAKKALGAAQIRIMAHSRSANARYKADIPVRASAQREYVTRRKESVPGGSLQIAAPGAGVSGGSKARLTLRLTPDMNLGPRLFELIHYPYGCIEQTISSVLPQLFIRGFIATSELADADIATNINAAIRKLRKFSLRSGAFSYWPGQNSFSAWGTNYAGHFMIEARKQGYYVPDDLFRNWLQFQQSRALLSTEDMTTRIYRLYLLALADNPAIGPMNLIKEGHLGELNNTQRWLLATAYQLTGNTDDAAMINSETGITIAKKGYDMRTYGTPARDKALILQQTVLFKKWPLADRLAQELTLLMRSDTWLSTQEKAFMIMALARYQSALIGTDHKKLKLSGTVVFEDGATQRFDTDTRFTSLNIDRAMGQKMTVNFSRACTSKRLFATLDWSGIPLTANQKDAARNLNLKVAWLDKNGRNINPSGLRQGQTLWGLFQVALSAQRGYVKNLALTQILPAGWEIESNLGPYNSLPGWASRLNPSNGTYHDVRDDRVHWFFNLQGRRKLNFLLKINVVSVGHFFLPGAMAEAMYDHSYLATKSGKWVDVKPSGAGR